MPHLFLLIIRNLMPEVIEFRQHHFHFQGQGGLIHLAPQLLPKRLDHLLSYEPGLLILPDGFLVQSLCFIIDLFHISIQGLQFQSDLMRLIFN